MSDTPRTDAIVARHALTHQSGVGQIYADFARQLERELAAMAKERDELAERVGGLMYDLHYTDKAIEMKAQAVRGLTRYAKGYEFEMNEDADGRWLKREDVMRAIGDAT